MGTTARAFRYGIGSGNFAERRATAPGERPAVGWPVTDAPPLPARTTAALRNTLRGASSRCRSPTTARSGCTPAARPSTAGRTSATCAATSSPTSSGGRSCTTAIPVLHVKNITDVGHLRDERFDRGEDRMLVAAGLESKTPAEIADAYEAGFHEDEALVNILPAHVFPRATEHVPDMLALATRSRRSGTPTSRPSGNLYYAVDSFPDYGRLSGNTLDSLRAGHRIGGRARQARPRRLRPVEGGRRGPDPPLAEPVGRRLPGLAPRVLGDGAALPRAGLRDPHRRHRQRLPPPRGRDRPVDAGRRAVRRCATGSTASTCWRRAARWRSPPATSSA